MFIEEQDVPAHSATDPESAIVAEFDGGEQEENYDAEEEDAEESPEEPEEAVADDAATDDDDAQEVGEPENEESEA